eukprot:COSAG01_NODE_11908_length_1837_cov_1.414845_2_plen_82_part_00
MRFTVESQQSIRKVQERTGPERRVRYGKGWVRTYVVISGQIVEPAYCMRTTVRPIVCIRQSDLSCAYDSQTYWILHAPGPE